MGDELVRSLLTIGTAIVGVAIIAVLVSNKASTSTVVKSVGTAFAQDLSAATNPFSGSSGSLSVPSFS